MSNLNIGYRLAYRLVLSEDVEEDAVDGVFGMVGQTLANDEAVRLAVSEGLSPGVEVRVLPGTREQGWPCR